MCDEMILIKLMLSKFIVENTGDDIFLHRTSQHPKLFGWYIQWLVFFQKCKISCVDIWNGIRKWPPKQKWKMLFQKSQARWAKFQKWKLPKKLQRSAHKCFCSTKMVQNQKCVDKISQEFCLQVQRWGGGCACHYCACHNYSVKSFI